MKRKVHSHNLSRTLWHMLSHTGIILLAVSIAFSLPGLANFILFTWWPMVSADSQLLLVNEIAFTVVLVALFNFLLSAWDAHRSRRINTMAMLVHARQQGEQLSRRIDRNLIGRIIGTRDVSVMSITGYDIFVSKMRQLRQIIDDCYELRVLLMNPYGPGALRRAQSIGEVDKLLEDYRHETEATVERLESLVSAGKKVTLKFYDEPPFWSLIVTGEHVWVQYCHDGQALRTQPEYVFALSKDNPAHGLFPAFYVHFLNHWDDPGHPEYDFSTRQLVYRNERGNETKRVPFIPQAAGPEVISYLRLAS